MASPDTTIQPPLIGAGSKVFAAIAASALLVGGVAGISQGDAQRGAMQSSALAASSDDRPHDEHAVQSDGVGDHAHDGPVDLDDPSDTAHPHGGAVGAAGPGTTAAGHDHTAGNGPTAPTTTGHEDHLAAGHDDSAGHAAAHDAETGEHGDDAGHTDHEPGTATEDHQHASGCADDHPETVQLVAEVQGELATTYKDIASLVALGYHPYFDSLVPGGWPPGGEGISHWINPNYIDDGVVLDPQRPETILLDDWNWPIGMMFINDPGVPPVPVYVNGDGTACSPWHPHTDAPARFGWYYYRAMYDRSIEGEVPEQTPEMMHVWAVPNPAGAYAAHDYPPREVRAGPPGPIPSYFSEVTVPGR